MATTMLPRLPQTAPSLEHYERRYQGHYSVEASVYNEFRFRRAKDSALNQRYLATLHELLDLQPGQSLLDAAAGTGQAATHLAAKGLQVTALDLTRNMLRQAQISAEDAQCSVRFVEGNARAIPFPNSVFDGVISTRFLHLFPTTMHRPFVKEMWRVLKPGGTLLIQFDSALAGGIAALAREFKRISKGMKRRYLFWPHEVARVFDDLGERTVYGFSVPGARVLEQHAPGCIPLLEQISSQGTASFLANHVFVRVVKPPLTSTETAEA